MNRERTVHLLITLLMSLFVASVALADVAPGDVIGKKEWEKAQGLLPDPVLDWVKKGFIVLNVGALQYKPEEYQNEVAKRSLEANRGKFDLDEDELFVEKATGKFPKFIEGIPFPELESDGIDPMADPKAGAKIMYNKFYQTYVIGNQKFPFGTVWLSRSRGHEREVSCEWQQYPMDGLPSRKNVPNPGGFERFSLIRVLAPFDIAGTNILLMRFRSKKMDNTFAYVPAIRRVRRMSPANRSDSFIGSDGCVDDAWLFDGKVNSFRWTILRKQDALCAFLDPEAQPLDRMDDGQLITGKGMKKVAYGYYDKSWAGDPWHPTNLVWMKRPLYVIKVVPKDPYYNYGLQYVWVDAAFNMMAFYKVIHDRSGKYWKVVWYSYGAFATPDGKDRVIGGTTMLCIDDRTDHGTIVRFAEPDNRWIYRAKLDRNDYTLGGFRKICK